VSLCANIDIGRRVREKKMTDKMIRATGTEKKTTDKMIRATGTEKK
jgi:hypothetical protein